MFKLRLNIGDVIEYVEHIEYVNGPIVNNTYKGIVTEVHVGGYTSYIATLLEFGLFSFTHDDLLEHSPIVRVISHTAY